MDEVQARERAQQFLDSQSDDMGGPRYVVTGQAESYTRSWVFEYEPVEGSQEHPAPGLGPLLVDRDNGTVYMLGTAPRHPVWARYYDRYGRLGSPAEVMQFSLGN